MRKGYVCLKKCRERSRAFNAKIPQGKRLADMVRASSAVEVAMQLGVTSKGVRSALKRAGYDYRGQTLVKVSTRSVTARELIRQREGRL